MKLILERMENAVKNGALGMMTIAAVIGLFATLQVLFIFLWVVEETEKFLFGAEQPKQGRVK